MKSRKDHYQKIVQDGFRLLEEQMAYSQAIVCKKMDALGMGIATATLSNIINETRAVGKESLYKAGEAMLQIVESELGYRYDEKMQAFVEMSKPPDWTPLIISIDADESQLIFHQEGRLSIPYKVAFLQKAQKEIIEFGVRLNAFSQYFITRSSHEFRDPMEALLEKGVNFKLYLLNPEHNAARFYFEDRAKVQEDEAKSIARIREVIEQLRQIQAELNLLSYRGKFEVFKYDHVPYCHFLIVDGETQNGRLMVSPYLYGIRRADCPVVEISKSSQRSLYRRYWLSFKASVEGALPI
ncbi:MAG TPA: DUF5919 domain-containing protein [Saprospiraceae bacterium]|nr:DUF5919 domain-containing protein [Saprospiraceae bacterium]HMQ81898.1 DUF5919 domain-containing protein [Saprospiraceae bacterium]